MRRRYSDFEWLKKELERDSKVGAYLAPRAKFGAIISVLLKSVLRRDDFCEWDGCASGMLRNADSTVFTSIAVPSCDDTPRTNNTFTPLRKHISAT